jgi:hypothetical protein
MERREFLQGIGLGGFGLANLNKDSKFKKEDRTAIKPHTDVGINIKEVIEHPYPTYKDWFKVIFSIDFAPGVPLTSGYHAGELQIGYIKYRKLLLVENSWYTEWDGKKGDIEDEKYDFCSWERPYDGRINIKNQEKGLYKTLRTKTSDFKGIFNGVAKVLVESQGKSFVYEHDRVKVKPNLKIIASRKFKDMLRL